MLTSVRRASGLASRSPVLRDDGGQDLIEYAYLAAFVGVAGYVALNGIVPDSCGDLQHLDRPEYGHSQSLGASVTLVQFRLLMTTNHGFHSMFGQVSF